MLCFQRTDEKCRLLGALRVRLPVPAGGDAEGRRNEILKMCPRWLNKEEGGGGWGCGGGAQPGVGGLNPCAGKCQDANETSNSANTHQQPAIWSRGTKCIEKHSLCCC